MSDVDVVLHAPGARDEVEFENRKLKTNIRPVNAPVALDEIRQLNPVRYQAMAADEVTAEGSDRKLGLVAENIEELFPLLITTNPDGKKAVDYVGLIPVLIAAVQELGRRVDELDQQMLDHFPPE